MSIEWTNVSYVFAHPLHVYTYFRDIPPLDFRRLFQESSPFNVFWEFLWLQRIVKYIWQELLTDHEAIFFRDFISSSKDGCFTIFTLVLSFPPIPPSKDYFPESYEGSGKIGWSQGVWTRPSVSGEDSEECDAINRSYQLKSDVVGPFLCFVLVSGRWPGAFGFPGTPGPRARPAPTRPWTWERSSR